MTPYLQRGCSDWRPARRDPTGTGWGKLRSHQWPTCAWYTGPQHTCLAKQRSHHSRMRNRSYFKENWNFSSTSSHLTGIAFRKFCDWLSLVNQRYDLSSEIWGCPFIQQTLQSQLWWRRQKGRRYTSGPPGRPSLETEGGGAGRSRHRTKNYKDEKTVVISVFTMATGAQKWLLLPRDGRQGLLVEKPVEQKQWKSLPFVPFSSQSLEIN